MSNEEFVPTEVSNLYDYLHGDEDLDEPEHDDEYPNKNDLQPFNILDVAEAITYPTDTQMTGYLLPPIPNVINVMNRKEYLRKYDIDDIFEMVLSGMSEDEINLRIIISTLFSDGYISSF